MNNLKLTLTALGAALLLAACGNADTPPAPAQPAAQTVPTEPPAPPPTNTPAPTAEMAAADTDAAGHGEMADSDSTEMADKMDGDTMDGAESEAMPVELETDAMAAAEPVDWLTHEGLTEDGAAYLGNPDAPVTIIDYSDFL